MKFHMTDDEIRRNWKGKTNTPREQLSLLATLNAVPQKAMRERLIALGFDDVPAAAGRPKKQKKTVAEMVGEAKEMLKADPVETEEGNEPLVVLEEPESRDEAATEEERPPVMTVGALMRILSAVSDDATVIVGGAAVTRATINARYSGTGEAMGAYVELG